MIHLPVLQLFITLFVNLTLCLTDYKDIVATNVVGSISTETRPVSIPPLSTTNRIASLIHEDSSAVIHDPHTLSRLFAPEEKLVDKLLNKGRLTVRPNGHKNISINPVHVEITYNVIQILEFSQAEETLSISGWFTLKWTDPRFTWNPADFSNIREVSLPSINIWIPDVGVMNGKSSTDFDFSANVRGRVTVGNDGSIIWLHGAVLDITCPLDVSFFPFDYQTCFLILTPWQSGEQQLLLEPRVHGSAVDNSYLPNSNVSEWEIQSVHFARKKYRSDLNITYQYVSIAIHLKRQPLYFVVLVLIPFSMLSGLACLIFTLDDTGDRLSVALSLVLSMTMYVVIVSTNAPRSMRTLPVLGIFLLDQLGLLSIATILAVINNKLYQSTKILTWQDVIYAITGYGHGKCNKNEIYHNQSCLNRSPSQVFPNKWQKNIIDFINKHPDDYIKYEKNNPIHCHNFFNSYKNPSYPNAKNCKQFKPEVSISTNSNYSPTFGYDDSKIDSMNANQNIIRNNIHNINNQNSIFDLEKQRFKIYNTKEHNCGETKLKPAVSMNFKVANKNRARSPWVKHLLPPFAPTSNNYHGVMSGMDLVWESSEDDSEYSMNMLQTTVTAVTAAAVAATKMLVTKYTSDNVHLPCCIKTNDKKNHNLVNNKFVHEKSSIKFYNKRTISHIAAQAAVYAAFGVAMNSHNSVDTEYQQCKCPSSNLRQSKYGKDKIYKTRSGYDKQTSENELYPYRKLASHLDCFQMLAYLFLSTINAIACLILMPRYSQDSNPPLHLIS